MIHAFVSAADRAIVRLSAARTAAVRVQEEMKALYENHMYNIISGRALLESEVEYLIAVYGCFLRRMLRGGMAAACGSLGGVGGVGGHADSPR